MFNQGVRVAWIDSCFNQLWIMIVQRLLYIYIWIPKDSHDFEELFLRRSFVFSSFFQMQRRIRVRGYRCLDWFCKFGWYSVEFRGGLSALILLTKIRCRLVGFRPVRKLIRTDRFRLGNENDRWSFEKDFESSFSTSTLIRISRMMCTDWFIHKWDRCKDSVKTRKGKMKDFYIAV